MRYKFRGKALEECKQKRIKKGDWVKGHLYVDSQNRYFIVLPMDSRYFIFEFPLGMIEVIPETVGQWTGFLDENDEEVYEGDILLAGITEEAYKVEVFWNEELGCWDMRDDEDLSYFDIYRGLSPFQTHDFRIIGNKWDNVDLLKGGEDD